MIIPNLARIHSYIGFKGPRLRKFLEDNKVSIHLSTPDVVFVRFPEFLRSGLSAPSWWTGDFIERIETPEFIVTQPLERREFDPGTTDYLKCMYDTGRLVEIKTDEEGWVYSGPRPQTYWRKIKGRKLNAYSYHHRSGILRIHLSDVDEVRLDLKSADPLATVSKGDRKNQNLQIALLTFVRRFEVGTGPLLNFIWPRNIQKKFVQSLRLEAVTEMKKEG